MFDELDFLRRVEAADTREFARYLSAPTTDEERVLRVYFGHETYARLHALAQQAADVGRGQLTSLNLSAPTKGRVVLIHGIMGAELGRYDALNASAFELVWFRFRRMLGGWVERLRLNDEGLSLEHDVRAVGIMKSHYGEMLLRLLTEQWDAHAFWFDWRKDLAVAANSLRGKIVEWFPDGGPVNIVAHSMGGLVARTFILLHPHLWEAMGARGTGGSPGGKLIMMGTPNYGSFTIPQTITGAEPTVRQLALLDLRHSLGQILDIVNTFPGSYQMLPSPAILDRMRPLYEAGTYGDLKVSQRHLDNALRHHEALAGVVDDERMIYVAGYNTLTPCDVRDVARLRSPIDYDVTRFGDGRVTHELGIPRLAGGNPIRQVYYTPAAHGNLARDGAVVNAVCELLESGETEKLERELPGWLYEEMRGADDVLRQELRERYASEKEEMVRDFASLVEQLQEQRGAQTSSSVSELERLARESLLGDSPAGQLVGNGRAAGPAVTLKQASELFNVEIRLKWTFIENVGEESDDRGQEDEEGSPAVDAIAVGHYFGYGKPLMAEEALDNAISRKLLGKGPRAKLADTERLLTLYSYRGIIRGELGQPFFLEDPRAPGRLVVLAGMGEAGRFWVPELTVLARELCWALGRIGKKHLATVLIGAGQGNMQVDEAVVAWLRGIKYALTSSEQDDRWRLRRITFVEADPRKLKVIEDTILQFIRREEAELRGMVADPQQGPTIHSALMVDYRKLDFKRLRSVAGKTIEQEVAKRVREAVVKAKKAAVTGDSHSDDLDVPIRITLSLDGKRYRFGAITRTAAVPDRETTVDPKLVKEANDALPAARDIKSQSECGRHLESLLMPKDLRPAFSTDAPVVMMLDAATARIHWEMVPQPDSAGAPADHDLDGNSEAQALDSFLSISRGFTRQLRTSFAPPPEPPPPPRRVLRVLIVADPWEENRLRGAEAEGREIEELFNEFNRLYRADDPESENKVEVRSLIGPSAATRIRVHRHLTLHHYDILHFAGHCKYDSEDPAASGWIFTGGDVLSANELNRIDNIPKFIFSNACESGVTPDRAELRTAILAPSFAEAFFSRGVSNFVCTAWPVSDTAARLFARTLYAALLGLEPDQNSEGGKYVRSQTPLKMHQAMQEARRETANSGPYGVQTWGAYQHYGNPYLQFFDRDVLKRAAQRAQEAEKQRAADSSSARPAGESAPNHGLRRVEAAGGPPASGRTAVRRGGQKPTSEGGQSGRKAAAKKMNRPRRPRRKS